MLNETIFATIESMHMPEHSSAKEEAKVCGSPSIQAVMGKRRTVFHLVCSSSGSHINRVYFYVIDWQTFSGIQSEMAMMCTSDERVCASQVKLNSKLSNERCIANFFVCHFLQGSLFFVEFYSQLGK